LVRCCKIKTISVASGNGEQSPMKCLAILTKITSVTDRCTNERRTDRPGTPFTVVKDKFIEDN